MTSFIIEKKPSGTGTIYDIASDQVDREIIFKKGYNYAVVLSSFYGGKGYTTHRTKHAALSKAKKLSKDNMSFKIIDLNGNEYTNVDIWFSRLVMVT